MTVDDYINQQPADLQRILRWLRKIIVSSDPSIREKIAWQIPVFTYRQVNVFYLNVVRSRRGMPPGVGIELGFMAGHHLPDELGMLMSAGRKQVRSLPIRGVDDPEADIVRTYIQEALLLIENRHGE
ncbi:DUF1801 domain-containing protein [Spirosoma sp. 209]|uniref:DUF1801 domain-containing protein n=1 Tax=Spirosoma sp. 209 TaxID=1955701 RepID=UPI00098D56FD|nr:DUF1801 domain-containing protein [Spirosoma sp. 209]